MRVGEVTLHYVTWGCAPLTCSVLARKVSDFSPLCPSHTHTHPLCLVCSVATDPPVLLLHGINQTAWSWEELALALASNRHYVVAVECRGHGDSQWSPAPKDYSCGTVAADLRLVCFPSLQCRWPRPLDGIFFSATPTEPYIPDPLRSSCSSYDCRRVPRA